MSKYNINYDAVVSLCEANGQKRFYDFGGVEKVEITIYKNDIDYVVNAYIPDTVEGETKKGKAMSYVPGIIVKKLKKMGYKQDMYGDLTLHTYEVERIKKLNAEKLLKKLLV